MLRELLADISFWKNRRFMKCWMRFSETVFWDPQRRCFPLLPRTGGCLFATHLDREGQFLTPTQNVIANTRKWKHICKIRILCTEKWIKCSCFSLPTRLSGFFCRVILDPESRASCNAAFIESGHHLPSGPMPLAECQINWCRVLL